MNSTISDFLVSLPPEVSRFLPNLNARRTNLELTDIEYDIIELFQAAIKELRCQTARPALRARMKLCIIRDQIAAARPALGSPHSSAPSSVQGISPDLEVVGPPTLGHTSLEEARGPTVVGPTIDEWIAAHPIPRRLLQAPLAPLFPGLVRSPTVRIPVATLASVRLPLTTDPIREPNKDLCGLHDAIRMIESDDETSDTSPRPPASFLGKEASNREEFVQGPEPVVV